MTETPKSPPQGWYPDPGGSGKQRWWDGATWTDQMQEQAPPPAGPESAATGPAVAAATGKVKKPWYRRPLPLVGVGFLVLVLISAAAGGGSKKDSGNSGSSSTATQGADTAATATDTTTAESTATKPKPANNDNGCGYKATGDCTPHVGPNNSVQVDTLRWRVTGAKTAPTIGEQQYGIGSKADGVYVIVNLSGTNGKNESVTLTDNVFQLEADGKKYDTDSDGTIAAVSSGDEPFFLKDVGPDVTAKGLVVFDVPKSLLAKKLEMRFNELGFGDTHGYIRISPQSS